MASEAELINCKLEFVIKKRGDLVEAVDQYVDQIVTKGRQWLALNQTEGFQEMSCMLEQSVCFISQKCTEVKRNNDGTNQSSSSSSTSHTQTRAVELPTFSSIHPNSLSQLEAVKDLATRVKVVEEAVASLCSSREQIKQQGSNVQNAIEELSKMAGLHEKHFEDEQENLKEQLRSLRQDVAKQKHQTDTNMHDIQTELEKSKSKTDEAVKNIQSDVDRINSKTDAAIQNLQTELGMTRSDLHGLEDRVMTVKESRDSDLQKTSEKLDNLQLSLHQLDNDMDTLTNELSKIESASTDSGQIVGFFSEQTPPAKVPTNRVFRNYINVINIGGHFNPKSGVFCAPADGLYIIYLRLCQQNDGRMELDLYRTDASGEALISWVQTSAYGDVKSDTYICHLSTDDRLFVKYSVMEGRAIAQRFEFSCHKLK